MEKKERLKMTKVMSFTLEIDMILLFGSTIQNIGHFLSGLFVRLRG